MEPLAGLDAFFLYAETEAMHMHVALTAILDPSGVPGGVTFERIRSHIADRIHLVPPFWRKLLPVPFGLHHPWWVQDPDFRLEHHLRRATLPQPGGAEDLGRAVGEISSIPLDRGKPLWEIWYLDGLADGNVALVAKVHHACVDGVSGAELMTSFFDLDPDSPARSRPERPVASPPPTDAELLKEAARRRVESLRRIGPLARRTIEAVGAIRQRRQLEDQGATPLRAPRTHFNSRISPNRNVAFAHVPLNAVKEIKGRFGCTVNDVVLATCAGALRRYLIAHGGPPAEPLVAAVPVSVRSEGEKGQQNNKVSFLVTHLHTHLADPAHRLIAIGRTTSAAKREHDLLGPTTLSEWADVLDPTLFRYGARLYTRGGIADLHPPMHNLVVSNVPGPPFPVYMAGAQLVRAYPMGPVMEGAGLNITVMSYQNSLDLGFMVCDELVPDVWDLADQVAPAFEELVAAGTPATSLAHPD